MVAYSDVGIANMMLQRIGAKSRITSLTDGSANAIKVLAIWDYILNLVLEEVKPKFATVRVALAQNSTAPANSDIYDYAYTIPVDYICLSDDSDDDRAVYPYPGVEPYVFETLDDGTLCLMTNYDSAASGDIYLTYIRKVADPAKYTASFIDAFAFRGAGELTFSVAESAGKYEAMMTLYEKAKRKARAASRAQDYQANDRDVDPWDEIGR